MIQPVKQVVRTWGTSALEAAKAFFDGFNAVKFGEVNINPAALAAGATAETAVALPAGTAAAGDLVFVQPPQALEAGLVPIGARISAADTLSVRLYNPTAAALDGAALTWTYLIVTPPRLAVV